MQRNSIINSQRQRKPAKHITSIHILMPCTGCIIQYTVTLDLHDGEHCKIIQTHGFEV